MKFSRSIFKSVAFLPHRVDQCSLLAPVCVRNLQNLHSQLGNFGDLTIWEYIFLHLHLHAYMILNCLEEFPQYVLCTFRKTQLWKSLRSRQPPIMPNNAWGVSCLVITQFCRICPRKLHKEYSGRIVFVICSVSLQNRKKRIGSSRHVKRGISPTVIKKPSSFPIFHVPKG